MSRLKRARSPFVPSRSRSRTGSWLICAGASRRLAGPARNWLATFAGHTAGHAAGARRYWTTEYDLGRFEARLNALPQFTTEIDGLEIHFIHVKSRHEDALPLIITHGWPGSVIEMLEVIGPLTDPTAHGGMQRTRLTS